MNSKFFHLCIACLSFDACKRYCVYFPNVLITLSLYYEKHFIMYILRVFIL